MPQVDPEDDSIWRFVLHHYRFDPARNQRRNVVVAAYDNQAELDAAVQALARLVHSEIAEGKRDPKESVGGTQLHPGHDAEQALGRLLRRAVSRGVDPRRLLGDKQLPSNAGLFGWDDDGTTWSIGGGEPPDPPPAD